MIYSQRYLFIHIPKTGGSSIKKMLNGNKINNYSHSPIKDFPFTSTNLYKFCFVRNPYDRIISAYYCLRFQHKMEISFKDFISLIPYSGTNKVISDFLKPQNYWIKGTQMNFIGRYENFNEDLQKIMKTLNIEVKIPHELKNKYSKIEFDNDDYHIINHHYHEDFKLFNYKKI